MLPSAITRQMLLNWGGAQVYAQAERIVKRGAVLQAEMQDNLISGQVAREGAPEIHTRLRLHADGTIESLCPCPANVRNSVVCPHVVALGITLMLRHSDPLRKQKYIEDQRRALRLASINPAAYLQRAPTGTPAQLRLTLSDTWIADFRRAAVPVAMHVVTSNGRQAPEQIKADTCLALSQADDNLLTVLEDICEGPPPGKFNTSAADFLNILDVSAHLPLHLASGGTLTIERTPVTVSLQVDLDRDSGELIIYPLADLPDAQAGELPAFLVHGKQGWVVARHRLWPIKKVLPIPYHSIYTQDEIVPRSGVINFLSRGLPELTIKTAVNLEVTPDLFVTEPGTPVLLLQLQGTKASLRATLSARYGEHAFPAGVPDSQSTVAQPDPDDILKYHTRNLPAEKSAVQLLTHYGFELSTPGYTLVGSREVLNFLGSGYPALIRSGWKISFSQKLNAIMETLRVITPVVQIEELASGDFDIGFVFDLAGQQPLLPAEIQRAINRGDSYLDLDGQPVLIDRDSVEHMRAVFSDCRSLESPRPGHFRLPQLYAPFVQASLNAIDGIDVEDPPDWRDKAALRNRSGNTRLTPIPLGTLDTILRPYQKEGVYWLRFLEKSGLNGLLADEMGLGKTIQTLAWLSLPRSAPDAHNKPALIVCPTSLVENWNREAETFVPHLRRLLISGPNRTTLFKQIPQHDLIITSYALLRRDLDAYRMLQFSVAVLDEAQHIKNRSTQNALAAKQVNAFNKLVLTGTPVENSVADLWSIMDFLMPGYLGDYEPFRSDYELPIAAGEREGDLAQAKLKRKIHPFLLRRLKRDVARDLPEKIVKVAYCQLSEDQQRVYNDIVATSRRTIGDLVKAKGFDRARFEILAILMRLRQVCCHLDLLKDHHQPGTYDEPSVKFDTFFELLNEALDGGHRMLVFSQFVTLLKLLRDELDQRNVTCCYLDGSTRDRLEQCQRFNLTPSIPVFLISLKAGGTGLNLTGADTVIHLDPWWNPAVEDQATDRAHRIGQKRTVYSIKLIAEHTVEEKVLAMQQRKQAIINATVGVTDQAVMQKLTFEDIRDLIGLS